MGLVAALGLALDQWTKHLAVTRLDPAAPPSYLGGFLRLLLVRNPGAAFSLGTGATVVISCLAIVAALALLVWAPRLRGAAQGALAGLALAGVVGNLVDRLLRPPGPLRGHVIDFISLPHFAVFNVADICLTTTAAIVVLASFRSPRERSSEDTR